MNDLNRNNLKFNYGKNHFICSLLVFVSHDNDYLLIHSLIHSCRSSFSAQSHILQITHEINCLSLSGFIFAEILWLLSIGQDLGYHCNFHLRKFPFASSHLLKKHFVCIY